MRREARVVKAMKGDSILAALWCCRHKMLGGRSVTGLVGVVIVRHFVLNNFDTISRQENNANDEELTTVINFEADIVRAKLAMFDLAFQSCIGKDVVKVGIGTDLWSKAGWRIVNL